jgi:3-oxoacyl-[acyl-carrier-protein] synthase II
MNRVKPVSVTGMGCLCAAGSNLKSCMDFLFDGKRHPAPPKDFCLDKKLSYPVFEILDDFFNPDFFKEPHVLRTGQLALTAAMEAVINSGVGRKRLKQRRVGVCIGTNVAGSVQNKQIQHSLLSEKFPYILPMDRFKASDPAFHIAGEFELSGPFQTIVNACSAGGDAIGIGASWIRSGLCDMVIAGGADALYPITYMGFISLMNSDDGPCKPFDTDRKGLNLGEGAAMMILESDTCCKKRGKSPEAFILGYGSAADAWHFTAPARDGKGLCLAIREALTTSGLSASDIAFINAHGTGTRDNDRIESKVFNNLFPGIPFLSTKGYVGHTLGAAGAIEAVFSIECLKQGRIPSSVGYTNPDPELPAGPVQKITEINRKTALSDTLAFGGNNSVLILGLEGE